MWHDYTKRPVTIQAVLLDEDNVREVGEQIHAGYWFGRDGNEDLIITGLRIRTLEGTMTANLGEYVIRGVANEYYPCRADIFEATYGPGQ